jgi:hypothetical protein
LPKKSFSAPLVENIFALDEAPVYGLSLVFQTELLEFFIPCFRREADENCAVLGHYAADTGNF